jgi:hypothetical protein
MGLLFWLLAGVAIATVAVALAGGAWLLLTDIDDDSEEGGSA